ncbi:MAG: DUF1415 domain-containing protein [Gammaproteobacteria bacterium]|nr:DUF1415 domain-containing protein [Gammaproteobacteria bacterium]
MENDARPDPIILTRNWLVSVVVGLDLCPFARKPLQEDRVQFQLSHAQDMEESLLALIEACKQLDQDDTIETILLIYPDHWQDFYHYLDLVEMADSILVDQGYEGTYQVASFHPDYCFNDADFDDASNYTNRSPYPMLHLIREQSLEQAIAHHPDPESIPDRNIELTRSMGCEKMQALLAACKNTQ